MLELFFDLIFVALIGGFVHRVEHIFEHGHFDAFSFSFLLMSLITAIFIWKSFTVYSSRYEHKFNLRHRMFTYLLMVGMSIITASLFVDFSTAEHFETVMHVSLIGYGISLSTLLYLHISTAVFTNNIYEKKRQLANSYGLSFVIVITIIATSIDLANDNELNRWILIGLWALGIVGWVIISSISSIGKIAINTRDTSLEHLQERFGIIFIVFIGESVIQTITGASKYLTDHTAIGITKIIVVFTILFCWWWWFSDTLNSPDIINHPARITIYKNSMAFLLIALSFAAIGLSGAIKDSKETYPKYLLGSAMIIWTLANSVVSLTLKKYNMKQGILIPKLVRIAIVAAPIWTAVGVYWFFAPFVSNETYLYIVLGISISLIPLSISIRAYSGWQLKQGKYDFEKEIEKYYINEEKWIMKSVVPKMDPKVHAQYNYELNHYSKFIKPHDK